MPSLQEMPITVVFRAVDRVSGESNNFVIPMPLSLPTYTQYWKVRMVNANLPTPLSTTYSTAETHRYVTGGVEVRADLSGRTHSYDTNRSGLMSMGFLSNSGFGFRLHKSLIQIGDNPIHIITNPNFGNLKLQLFNSDGVLLQTRKNSDGALTAPENGIFTFEFTPILPQYNI